MNYTTTPVPAAATAVALRIIGQRMRDATTPAILSLPAGYNEPVEIKIQAPVGVLNVSGPPGLPMGVIKYLFLFGPRNEDDVLGLLALGPNNEEMSFGGQNLARIIATAFLELGQDPQDIGQPVEVGLAMTTPGPYYVLDVESPIGHYFMPAFPQSLAVGLDNFQLYSQDNFFHSMTR